MSASSAERTSEIILEGLALHAGLRTAVVVRPQEGPTRFEQAGLQVPLCALRILRADRGVTVTDASGRLQIDLVEHLLAAVGALGLESGLCVRVEGPEVPLLDGGARRFALELRSLGVAGSEPQRRVAREARFEIDGAVYEFEPSPITQLEVTIDYDHPLIAIKEVSWSGDAEDFVLRIASARTYGFLREAEALWATARAQGANARDVVVLCDEGTSISDPQPTPDECVRHKLLDLIGDLTLCGGLPRGLLRAHRPGHRSTHQVLRWAAEQGVFAPVVEP